MKLSEDLQCWRCHRPDEWTMDRFIKKADDLELDLVKLLKWQDLAFQAHPNIDLDIEFISKR